MIYYGVFYMQKKIKLIAVVMACMMITCSCGYEKIKSEKTKDIDYTVVAESEIPKDVNKIIEQRKEKEFKVAYSDEQYTYIIIGYGVQKYQGYSIKVKEIYETENSIYVKTEFKGPDKYTNTESKSYPYIVIKIKDNDKNIIFSE
jgi:hypothetical protein